MTRINVPNSLLELLGEIEILKENTDHLLESDLEKTSSEVNALRAERDSQKELATQLIAELDGIVNSRSYKVLQKIKNSLTGKLIFSLGRRIYSTRTHLLSISQKVFQKSQRLTLSDGLNENTIRILTCDSKNPSSLGHEIWLLDVISDLKDQSPILPSLHFSNNWELQKSEFTSTGYLLFSSGRGYLDIPKEGIKRLLFQTHPWSGYVSIAMGKHKWKVDLFSEQNGTVDVDLTDSSATYGPGLEKKQIVSTIIDTAFEKNKTRRVSLSFDSFTSEEEKWIEHIRHTQKPVTIIHPEWLGIRSSAQQLFNEILELPDRITETSGQHYAQLIIEANCPAIVIQGFPLTYLNLIRELKRLKPDMKIFNIWHGGFIQSDEDYNWRGFKIVEQLCREGVIEKWGFVKKGMAEIVSTLGIRTGFVMNYVREIPEKESIPMYDDPHLGVWSSWRKTPYVALAAGKLIPSVKLDLYGYKPERVVDYIQVMKIPAVIHPELIPQHKMNEELIKYHLNLYVSFYECTPMLPLESLSIGTPCLMGPNSHLFEEHDYLHSRLVVPYPDRSEIIAKHITLILEERKEIIDAYRDYATKYNREAKAALKNFLNGLEV